MSYAASSCEAQLLYTHTGSGRSVSPSLPGSHVSTLVGVVGAEAFCPLRGHAAAAHTTTIKRRFRQPAPLTTFLMPKFVSCLKSIQTSRIDYRLEKVAPGQSSVRNGEAGKFSLLNRLQSGLSAQA